MFPRKRRIDLGTARSLVLGAFALGAGLVYFLDPQNGLPRRVRVREQLERAREKLRGQGERVEQARLREVRSTGAEPETRDSLF